jgi:glycosyltransferase involved in cell wall biosynthesis
MKPSLSLIIPTLNERENILPLMGRIAETLGSYPFEIIVADDNSSDGTAVLAEDYARTHPNVRVLRRTSNPGLSAAIVDAFSVAEGDFLGVMDADMSHDEKILPALIKAVEDGTQIAIGSRRVPGGGADKWPFIRRAYSNAATLAAKIWLNTGISDPMSGYFIINRAVYEQVKNTLNPKGYNILLELAVRSGELSVKVIPFVFKDRTQGYSKLSGKVAAKYLEMLFDLRGYGSLSARRRRAALIRRFTLIAGVLGGGPVLDVNPVSADNLPSAAFLTWLNRPGSAFCGAADYPPCAYLFTKANLPVLPFAPGSFKNVTVSGSYENPADFAVFAREARRVLAKNGIFVIAANAGNAARRDLLADTFKSVSQTRGFFVCVS